VSEEQFQLQLDNTTVGDLLYHTAEVEYMFSEWFFASPNKKEIIKPTDKSGYIQLLQQSNEHFMLAMKELPEEKWNQIQQSVFEEQFQLQLDNTTVGDLLYHTAEVEYMFSEWFFASPNKKEIIKPTDKSGYIQLLQQSNEHFMLAMKELPEEKWNQIQQSAFGNSTPL